MDSKQVLVLCLIICFSIEKTYAFYTFIAPKEQQQQALRVSKIMYDTLSITDDQYTIATKQPIIKKEDVRDLRDFEKRVVKPVKSVGISDDELLGLIRHWVN
ncbi:uncharacterized protein LOC126846391 [Adelges cooleyi]|uniref:uncharacterized protein LOC126846391 n=1 Tax=Adelges cooleyi TaxID=133065 RepID=UPI00217F9A72|nr:uncharacterized protein LOC126846391 [Adelges cooleyi]